MVRQSRAAPRQGIEIETFSNGNDVLEWHDVFSSSTFGEQRITCACVEAQMIILSPGSDAQGRTTHKLTPLTDQSCGRRAE